MTRKAFTAAAQDDIAEVIDLLPRPLTDAGARLYLEHCASQLRSGKASEMPSLRQFCKVVGCGDRRGEDGSDWVCCCACFQIGGYRR